MTVLYAVFAVSACVVAFGVLIYNRFVKQENLCDEAFSGVQVQLKRRYDLIPNIVSCVKGYAAHEQETLEAIVEKRNAAMNAAIIATVLIITPTPPFLILRKVTPAITARSTIS